MLRFYVDFNTIQQYDFDRIDIYLDQELQLHAPLVIGMNILLYDSSLEVEGQLYFDEQHKLWYAIPNWSTKRNLIKRFFSEQ